jgi:predicted kinase
MIIRGPLGVGKTAVAGRLAKLLGAEHISMDSVLEKHGLDKVAEGEECIPAGNFIKADDIIFPKVKEMLGQGKTVIFDGCFYHKEHIAHITKSLAYPGVVFTLKASLETCIDRDSKRAKPYGKDAAGAVHHLVSRFDSGTIIQTEGKTIGQVLDEIRSHLQKRNLV